VSDAQPPTPVIIRRLRALARWIAHVQPGTPSMRRSSRERHADAVWLAIGRLEKLTEQLAEKDR